MEFNKQEIIKSSGKWMESENFILSELTGTQKDKYCMLTFTCRSWRLIFTYVCFCGSECVQKPGK